MAKLDYSIRQKLIDISGTCFWYWGNLHSFLESCGIKRDHFLRYGRDNKYNVMRNILTDLEERNDEDALKAIVKAIYNLKTIPDTNVPDPEKAMKLIAEFKQLCGPDLIEKEIEEIKRKERSNSFINETKLKIEKSNQLSELNNQFLNLFTNTNHQQRGFDLERIVYNLFHYYEFEIQKPYKVQNEQIDGWYKYEKFDYLLEIKWIEGQIKQGHLSEFDKKIDKKAKSTRGHFIAMNGFDEDAVQSISGKEPRIVLMDGEDLALILNGSISLYDAIKSKVDKLVKEGNTFYKIKNILIR